MGNSKNKREPHQVEKSAGWNGVLLLYPIRSPRFAEYIRGPQEGGFRTKMTTLDTSKALCTQTDPELFFSEKWEDVEQARDICKRCPIMEDCLEQAMRENIPFGVWGGATYPERNLFKREPRKKLQHIYITMGGKINDENTKGYK